MPIQNRKIEFLITAKDASKRAFGKVEGYFHRLTQAMGGFMSRLGSLPALIGGAGIGALALKLKSVATEMDAVAKSARRIGISTEELSKLSYAAELNGVSVETLNSSLERMLYRVSKASEGSKELSGALGELNLDAETLEQLAPEEQFKRIAEAMTEVEGKSDRIRLTRALFGRDGVGALNLIEQGREGIERLGDELETLGGVIDNKAAAAAERFNDNLARLGKTVDGLTVSVAGPLLEALDNFAVRMGQVDYSSIENLQKRMAVVVQEIHKLRELGVSTEDFVPAYLRDQIPVLEELEAEYEKLADQYVKLNKEQVKAADETERLAKAQEASEATLQKQNELFSTLTKQIATVSKEALPGLITQISEFGKAGALSSGHLESLQAQVTAAGKRLEGFGETARDVTGWIDQAARSIRGMEKTFSGLDTVDTVNELLAISHELQQLRKAGNITEEELTDALAKIQERMREMADTATTELTEMREEFAEGASAADGLADSVRGIKDEMEGVGAAAAGVADGMRDGGKKYTDVLAKALERIGRESGLTGEGLDSFIRSNLDAAWRAYEVGGNKLTRLLAGLRQSIKQQADDVAKDIEDTGPTKTPPKEDPAAPVSPIPVYGGPYPGGPAVREPVSTEEMREFLENLGDRLIFKQDEQIAATREVAAAREVVIDTHAVAEALNRRGLLFK